MRVKNTICFCKNWTPWCDEMTVTFYLCTTFFSFLIFLYDFICTNEEREGESESYVLYSSSHTQVGDYLNVTCFNV